MQPRLTNQLAEVTGTLIGDGCLSRFWASYDSRWRHQIVFTGSADEFPYYAGFVQPIIQETFGVRGRLFIRTYKGLQSTRYYITSPKLFDFFVDLGIPVGVKSHAVFIPQAFFGDKELLRSCLRGMWDADGCVYQRYTKPYKNHARWYPNYLVLQYKSASEKLIFDMKKALDLFSIRSNKILKTKNNIFVLYINTQSEIQKFLDSIGFRNPHHLNRLARFRSQSI
jgi:DNA-binding transcriptional regulator WhiA